MTPVPEDRDAVAAFRSAADPLEGIGAKSQRKGWVACDVLGVKVDRLVSDNHGILTPHRNQVTVRSSESGEEAKTMTKAMTLRLETEQHETLQTIAEVDGRHVSDVVRTAIDEMIERARNDAEFQKRVEAAMKRHQKLLEKLATH
jgi:predicted DNA-binding protein